MTTLALAQSDLHRVCRDLAWSEIAAMPGLAPQLGPRVSLANNVDWASTGLALDSLARMQLATAAATWCNAYDAGFEDLFLAKRSAADWAAVMVRARASGAAHFTFSTSGSTGARKHIRHQEDVLANEAKAWATVLNAANSSSTATGSDVRAQADGAASGAGSTPIKRVLVLAPTHHIYGFIWGVLLPLALGVPAVDADFANLPELLPGDLLVAVPDQWAWLANSARPWPSGVQGISSTAPLPSDVHRSLTDSQSHTSSHTPSDTLNDTINDTLNDTSSNSLLEALTNKPGGNLPAPLSRLLQIYGSSETAGLAWRDDPQQPYTLAPDRSRTPADGIELLLPNGAFAAMPVQDDLDWVSATQFHLLRRVDHSVQVGGHNVSPDWVAGQLMTHGAVKAAAVRLDALLSPPRLKAFVVLRPATSMAEKQALETWAVHSLPQYASLASVTYGDALPLNAMGKPSDWPT